MSTDLWIVILCDALLLLDPPISFTLQTARWKVTSKEALQRISEYSEAAITIRGTYFPPGKEPKEGERKIYLAIESMYSFYKCFNERYDSSFVIRHGISIVIVSGCSVTDPL